jgi:MoaA/NifB/PqqE/SkfB family radical SAM enzyme
MHSKLAYLRFGTSFIVSALLGRRSLSCLWELTYRCTARCAICAYWRHPSDPRAEMTLPQIQDGLERVYRHGCRFVNFTGGEPTLRPDLEGIVHHASHLGMWTSVVTNGGTLTRERVRSLKRAGLDSLMISVDSPDPATHDRIRGVAGLHRRVLESLRVLSEEFLTGLRMGGLMCVLARHNIDDIRRIVALADELGVYVLFQPYHERKTGSRAFCADISPSHAAAMQSLGRTYGNLLNSSQYLTGIARYACGGGLPTCHAGKKYFSIDPFGYVHPCVDLPAVGHLLRDTLTVLRGETACREVSACRGCWYCFRGEADSSLNVAAWLDRMALGLRVARRNLARRPAGGLSGAAAPIAGIQPWTPHS